MPIVYCDLKCKKNTFGKCCSMDIKITDENECEDFEEEEDEREM